MTTLPTSPTLLLRWPWVAVLLLAVGLILLGVPENFEGPTLFNVPDDFARPTPIDTGTKHGFTLTNGLAIAALVGGLLLLAGGGWLHRTSIAFVFRKRPLATKLLGLQLALGIVFIGASGTSTVLRWWGPGTILSIVALFGLAFLVWETLMLPSET